MKKVRTVLLSVVLLVASVCFVSAAETENRIFAEVIKPEDAAQISIPIQIEHNTGFMGFSIIVTYDADVFTPVGVTKGQMLNGLMNDSIETSTDNSFKVVYSGSENVTNDGVLFTLEMRADDAAAQAYTVRLSYSQPDTFNESWKDIVFNCEDVTVDFTQAQPTEPVEPPTEPDKHKLSETIESWYQGQPSAVRIALFVFVRPIILFLRLIGQ